MNRLSQVPQEFDITPNLELVDIALEKQKRLGQNLTPHPDNFPTPKPWLIALISLVVLIGLAEVNGVFRMVGL